MLRALDQRGLRADTDIIVVSDHGFSTIGDLHNTCVAGGPDFRAGVVVSLPSGNLDIAPTLLWLMNVSSPAPLDGRVLLEALRGETASVGPVELGRREAEVNLSSGTWQQYLLFTELNGERYLEEGDGRWEASAPVTKRQ